MPLSGPASIAIHDHGNMLWNHFLNKPLDFGDLKERLFKHLKND
jgi:hypothetical protein